MFGAAAAPSTSGFSFGASNPAATQQAATPSTGFNFGASASTNQPATSQPTGFSFGAGTTPAATTGFNGFSFSNAGTPSTSTPAAATSTGFSFGANSAAKPAFGATSSAFGAPATPSAFGASTTPSAFGTSNTPSAFGTTPSAFGTTPSAFGASGFGSSTPSAFGASTPAAFGATTPSAFGASTPSAFGASTASAFGASTPSAFEATTPSAFGAATPTAFGASPQMQMTQLGADSPAESLNAIKMAYTDPQRSRFKHMFYNVVDPAQRQFYVRPAHISERLWKQAEADNPDPTNCVPTAVVGFKELSERIKTQQTHADKLNTFVDGLKSTVSKMGQASRATDAQLQICREQHVLLFHKLIEIMRKIEVYQCLRKPYHPEELRLKESLQHLQEQLNHPSMFKAKLNELVSIQRMQAERSTTGREQLNTADIEAVHRVIKRQVDGLQHLTNILKRNMRDVEIMKKSIAAR